MFDFNKLGMHPTYTTGFETGASDTEIAELEKHCGHVLPESYKLLLKNYNGGSPEAKYFDAIDESTGILGERKIDSFYILDKKSETPADIWWVIKHYSKILGPNTLPFADDGLQQIYYMKWVNGIPQVWFLAYLDLEEPQACYVMPSFDELLESLYAE